jgi:hypothetical protein
MMETPFSVAHILNKPRTLLRQAKTCVAPINRKRVIGKLSDGFLRRCIGRNCGAAAIAFHQGRERLEVIESAVLQICRVERVVDFFSKN